MQHDRRPLREIYHGRWRSILSGLGIPEKLLVNRHGPCPACGGKDRFRFDDKDGYGTYICSQCGAGDGPKLAMLFLGVDFKEMAERIGAKPGSDQTRLRETDRNAPDPSELPEDKRKRMNALWREARPVSAIDPAGRYLAGRIKGFPEGTGLRFHPACQYPKGAKHPTLLAIFAGSGGKASGLHRTYLTEDGRKAAVVSQKLSLGPLVDGGAVRLAEPGAILGIAEGIETALAASVMFGVPCWAALNANRLAVWEPPAGVERVTIFADNDESFTGQTAAFDLAARLAGRVAVDIETPFDGGCDWADVLARRR
ncbi:MAG: toprim domain-containing protein [Devosia sp.]